MHLQLQPMSLSVTLIIFNNSFCLNCFSSVIERIMKATGHKNPSTTRRGTKSIQQCMKKVLATIPQDFRTHSRGRSHQSTLTCNDRIESISYVLFCREWHELHTMFSNVVALFSGPSVINNPITKEALDDERTIVDVLICA